ncbi:hypothetical protein POM88_031524 [Heracleum sosnowskyi]|nr:hypothetical protein POM88_031524 [Heracleum sosnowskyi]
MPEYLPFLPLCNFHIYCTSCICISKICASAVISDGSRRRSVYSVRPDHRYRIRTMLIDYYKYFGINVIVIDNDSPMVALVNRNFHKLRPSSSFDYDESNDIQSLLSKFANNIQSVRDLGNLEVINLTEMDFGKGRDNEKYMFEKTWDSEKM